MLLLTSGYFINKVTTLNTLLISVGGGSLSADAKAHVGSHHLSFNHLGITKIYNALKKAEKYPLSAIYKQQSPY